MVSYKYIPIDYFTYNRPDYVGAMLLAFLFWIMIITLITIYLYEYFNAKDMCHPMFYYGKGCQNQYSRQLLFSPNFINFKKVYYDIIGKYDRNSREYEGVRRNTYEDKKIVEESEKRIDENIKSNEEFMKDSIEEIKNLTEVANKITTQYLANIQSVIDNIRNVPQEVIDSLIELPKHLEELKNQIQSTMSNPTLSHYTRPLQLLYRSLTDINKKTNSHISPSE